MTKDVKSKNNDFLLQDVGIIVLSILVAIILAKTNVLSKILTSTQELKFLGSFVTGLFFTSAFTTAPAIVTLGEISRANSLIGTAFFGAIGAVVGDMIIFRFFRDRFSQHLMELLKHQGGTKRIRAIFKLKMFRWLTFMAGGLIIASPLPDELGITLLGLSKMNAYGFAFLSLVFNFLGIILIGLVARSY